jgi:hypothetical protein
LLFQGNTGQKKNKSFLYSPNSTAKFLLSAFRPENTPASSRMPHPLVIGPRGAATRTTWASHFRRTIHAID